MTEHLLLPKQLPHPTVGAGAPLIAPTSTGYWVIVRYLPMEHPRPEAKDWVFPHFWTGPDTATWHGTAGHLPRDAALFDDEFTARAAMVEHKLAEDEV